MQSLGHSREDAEDICGEIEGRAESGMLYKAQPEMQIIKSHNDIILYGPATWELLDREGDYITIKTMQRFAEKLFTKAEYRAIMDEHSNFIAGEPLLSYVASDGRKYRTHVHEKGLMLVAKLRRDDGLQKTRQLREKVLSGQYRSFSIAGRPIDFKEEFVKGQRIVYHYDIDPDEISLCREGVNPKARFRMIEKSTLDKPKDAPEQWAAETEQLKQDVAPTRQDIYRTIDRSRKVDSRP